MKSNHGVIGSSLVVGLIAWQLVSGGLVWAQDDEVAAEEASAGVELVDREPRVLATSPWYVLKEWWWAMVAASHFDEVKKQEVRLEHMNERLAEVQALMNGEVDARTQAGIEKTLDRYQRDADKFQGWVGGLQEDARTNPALQTLLQKNAGWEVQRQYLLERLANDQDVGPELQATLNQAVASSFTGFIDTLNWWGQPASLVADVMQFTADSSWLQKLYTMDFLQRTTEAKPEVTAEAKQAVKELAEQLPALPPTERAAVLTEFLRLEPSPVVIDQLRQIRQIAPELNEAVNRVNQERRSSAQDALEATKGLFE